ncbi:hypothetical protein KO498_05100 [Lentibacter algarum]|uniref:hypothetical protein n=1 Tax=Lentibacter algarum TaxID=576131 RepID=UPI001C06D0A5|nr:hypothetical protein [Lentibacter algarum]MBU2981183.1 hypothetical protein [Lentibacter algarum]
MNLGIIFDPLVGWPVLAGLAFVSLLAVGFAGLRGLQGAWLRAFAAVLVLAVLSGPMLQNEERAPLSDIVFVLTDDSASQSLSDRPQQTEEIKAELLRRLNARANTELREITLQNAADDTGTKAMAKLAQALAEEPRNQVAGAVIISDGIVHDMPQMPAFPAPVHLLRTGKSTDWDRRLIVENAPAFAIIGEPVELTLRIENQGAFPPEETHTQLSITVGAEAPMVFDMPIGREIKLPVTLSHGGRNLLKFDIPQAEGEITERNNTFLLEVNGVRDRLRVLLVSGEPHAGGRTWRNLLKSDSSVDLVHFTILRPPEKHDGVPVGELSLIAFPTRELFVEKINDFDLIIFDRYKRRGILPTAYLENVRDYVRDGGAVLVATGPDFASADSIYRSPLGEVLPGQPTARVLEEGFRPMVTDLGNRHPVTRGLTDDGPAPDWGRWMRQIEVEQTSGDVVMTGVGERPLLILDRVEEGRVALLASDHAWLWARGYEGGGPQLELLRRLSHWMMREPELEEEALAGEPTAGGLKITRRSLLNAPEAVQLTNPSGATSTHALTEVSPGVFEAEVRTDEQGLFRLASGDQVSVAGLGPASPKEFVTTIATDELIMPILESTSGGSFVVEDGLPTIRNVREGRNASGARWMGLTPRRAYETVAIKQFPLLPPWLALAVFALFIVAGWLREGRR